MERIKKINDYLYKAHKLKEDMIKRILEENRILTNKNIKIERIHKRILERNPSDALRKNKSFSHLDSMRTVALNSDAKIKFAKGTVIMDCVKSISRT